MRNQDKIAVSFNRIIVLSCLLTLILFFSNINSVEFPFKRYSSEYGFASSQVWYAYQDSYDYIWFCCTGGLSRFSGKQFVNYTDEEGLVSNITTSIIEVNKGEYWIGTFNGVSHLKNGVFTNFTVDKGFPGGKVWEIAKDKDNNIWFGIEGGGVVKRTSSGNFTVFDTLNSLPFMSTRSIYYDELLDAVWVGSRREGFGYIKDDKYISAEKDFPGFEKAKIEDFFREKDSTLWICSEIGLIKKYKEKTTYITEKNGLVSNDTRDILKDGKNQYWIATKYGLSYLKDDEFFNFTEETGISNNYIYSVLKDKEDNLWFTTSNGLTQLQTKAIMNYTKVSGLNASIVLSVFTDSKKRIWIGSHESGLYSFNEVNTFYNYKDEMVQSVWDIVEDKNGNLWIATSYGIVVWDPDRRKPLQRFISEDEKIKKRVTGLNVLPDERIKDLFVSPKGKIYSLSINEQLGYFDGYKYVPIELSKKMALNAAYIDYKNNLWLGSLDKGAFVYDKNMELIHIYDISNILPNMHVTAFFEDSKKNMWIGTSSGLVRLSKDGNAFVFSKKNGMMDNTSNFIIEDKHGNIWTGTDYGLHMIRGDNTAAVFDMTSGLLSNESTTMNACSVSEDNKLYIGLFDGLSVLNVESLQNDDKIHFPFITGIELDDTIIKNYFQSRSFDKENPLVIDNHIETIYFNFESPYFSAPDKIQYSFILEGYDNKWSKPVNYDFARYLKLPGGEYVFKVKSRLPNKDWSSVNSAYIYKKPKYYEILWVKISLFALGIIILTMLGTGIIAVKTRNDRLKQIRLQHLVEERTAELKKIQRKMLLQAHSAGKAEMAIGVLHNVGNAVNSFGVRLEDMKDKYDLKTIDFLSKIVNLLNEKEQKNEISEFFKTQKGKQTIKLLEKTLEDLHSIPENMADDIEFLITGAKKIMEIISLQQTYASYTAHKTNVNIRDIIDDVIHLKKDILDKSKISVNIFEKETCQLHIDGTRLFQAFLNIIQNSIEAFSEIESENKKIDIYISKENEKCIIRFKDNGIGIDEKDIDNIFQINYSTKNRDSGFGLHDVANFVSANHGKIEGKSKGLNKGAEFVFTFLCKE